MDNLPVILLKGLVLLPKGEIRLEFDDEISVSLVEISNLFHDDKIIVINQFNNGTVDIEKLPKYGVLGKIKNKLVLPNGKTRLTIFGKRRVFIDEYYKIDNLIESRISDINYSFTSMEKEQAYLRKLYSELNVCINKNPNISNSVLTLISDIDNLDEMTDVVAPYLPIKKERLCEYANTISSIKRANMILLDIANEMQVYEIEKDIDNKIRQELDNSQREYILKEKLKIIKSEIGDTSIKEEDVKNLYKKLNRGNYPENIRSRIKKEINRYESMSDLSPEISVVRKYIDWLLDLPWINQTTDLDDINQIEENLDRTHFGLREIKTRIIEYLSVKKLSPKVNTPIICLVGPPGVGKTTLAYSIAKSINRNFVKISVAGINDEADIMGHMKSYLGASPGRIISELKKASSNNPVFLIDEIDKMSKSYKGDPTSCLLEILDYNQNSNFCDNYLEESFDLSNIMFILTANDINKIPDALKDRLEIIEIKGYTEYEKIDLTKKYLLPTLCMKHGIHNIEIDNETIFTIVRKYTRESGVRELERLLSKIIRKISMLIVSKKEEVADIKITRKDLKDYLGRAKYEYSMNFAEQVGVVNGLSCTSYGGDILPIEVNYYKGNGKLILTGSLGNVIKESAKIALSYIKANANKFKIKYEDLISNDIHIHIPSGAILKEGPSAGVALTTSLISAFSKLKVSNNVAMTGEITLRGNILPIGGLKEKSIGAISNNIKSMFIPFANRKDLDEIPKEIRNKINYIPVKNYMDIYNSLENKKC